MSFEGATETSSVHHVNYVAVKKKLEHLLEREPLKSSKKHYVQEVIAQIERLKKSSTLSETDASTLLYETEALLTHTITPEAYQEKARTVQGSPSRTMKILGALMITLGTIVATACITIGAIIGFQWSAEGLFGAGALAAGIGIFSGGMRTGLSKSMNELADSVKPEFSN